MLARVSYPAAAVAAVLADAVEDVAAERDGGCGRRRPAWWADWYAGLDPAARAAAQAAAVTWATQLWTALDWSPLRRRAAFGPPGYRWCPASGRLVLRARFDVLVRADSGPVAIIVGQGDAPGADWRLRLGWEALVAGLSAGPEAVPRRVVGLWPASGQVRFLPVDAAVLVDVSERVADATAAWGVVPSATK